MSVRWNRDESPLTLADLTGFPGGQLPIDQTPDMHRRPLARSLVPLAVAVAAAATSITFATVGATSPSDTPTTTSITTATTPETTQAPPPTTPATPPATEDPGPDTTAAPPDTEPPATLPPESSSPQTTPPIATTPVTRPAPEAATTTTEASAQPAPLRILLTNDDGWDAEGITAVHTALVAAGHDVVLVAPATNQSGASGEATFVGELTLTQQADGVFSVDGTPADATELGLDIAFGGDLPDLVISGSNAGQNIGAIAVHSGTIGAAVTALNDGVPTIAVSTEKDLATGEGDFEGTADFVVAVVGALADRADGGRLLPDDIGLNINFPLVEGGGDPAGVAITTTDSSFLDIDYSAVSVPPVGEAAPIGPGLAIVGPTDPDSDTARLAGDFVTITFITNDYDVAPPATADAIDELGPLLVDLAL